ncbi:extracellular catalytic domain type 2 short-chain-length polyhydroxyalkanoate depolymerase [Aliiglaciecola lipolytica]|uniref:Poly (3-hydroxybutyrate) depolymerase n=1 Tax=Aliiglaciecola lipolytica E3 TaxID=1127673 RepID=K6Y8H4_9ALTE|nr:PHB depolymerase family esterase [Aliiglaciecola lipolytica]GAC12943.1 poly (3-hydroxybutyrate) depolymerase [Aliiglaciecola lipolytica E3]
MIKLHKLVVLIGLITSIQATAEPTKLDLAIEKITVSGLSSGGFMANQFHIAHSDWVRGAAILAAGPYYCAQGSITTALSQCVNKQSDEFSLAPLNAQLKQYADKGLIAPLSNLKDSQVWLLHGTLDARVTRSVANALFQQYQTLVAPENLTYVKEKPFAHHFPTLASGARCDTSESPFLGNCQFDAAGELLNYLYSDLTPPVQKLNGKINAINQHELGGEPAESLAETGYLYVPQACARGQTCEVHVNFHGCNQNAETIGQEYIQNNGLNRWADSNQLVVLYPQTNTSMMLPMNPQGCWDWWGYTDENYANQQGQQIQAVKNIVKSLAVQPNRKG